MVRESSLAVGLLDTRGNEKHDENHDENIFFCSTLLRCDLLAKKVPGRAPYSQHIMIRNWT